MLWEKESDDGPYTNILNVSDRSLSHLMGDFDIMKPQVNPKTNARAKEYRLKGNGKVDDLEWRDAIEWYNKCLCFAEKGSENFGLAYANRSLCFLKLKMYKKCLNDIKLAMNADYPHSKMEKLNVRRAFCLNQLKQGNQTEDDEPKLDFPEHELFPGIANILNIECDKQYGRHLVATCNIEVGKVVLVEEAFVSTPVMSTDKMVCSKCFKDMMNFIPCHKCNNSMYCSETCKETDEFHNMTCGEKIESTEHFAQFVARSLALAVDHFPKIGNMIEFVEDVVKDKKKCAPLSMVNFESKYRAFLKCMVYLSGEERKKLNEIGYKIFFQAMKNDDVKIKIKTNEDARFLMHLTLRHLYIIKCNSFQNKMSGGIFLVQKHLNHSCAPNLLQYFTANKTICFTSRSIKKGAQLFITYGNEEFWLEPTFVRQEVLLANFNFKCECEKCFGFGKKKLPETDISWLTGETSVDLKVEEDYQFIRIAMKNIDYRDTELCTMLKEKCLGLLKKFHAMPWASELDILCNAFVRLLNETKEKTDEKNGDKTDDKNETKTDDQK